MSKKIPLHIFTYSKRYYLTHPWKWFKDIRIGIKNFFHRALYGYAWIDLWNTDNYLTNLAGNMIEELAARSCGYPQCDEWPEFEDWQEELEALARAIHLCEPDFLEDEWNSTIITLSQPPEEKRFDRYLFNEDEIHQVATATGYKGSAAEARYILKHKIFVRLEELFDTLWD